MSDVIEGGQKPQAAKKENDFSEGSVIGNILKLAFPMTLTQLISVLYNIVDRAYIGMIPENTILSFTRLGLYLPIISMVIAFANLFGMGGVPLCSTERGRDNKKKVEVIMGSAFVTMMVADILLTMLGLIFKRPMLYLFGANDATVSYADSYITTYLLGNIFVMTGLRTNSFINSQGFETVGMMTVLLGAIINIILDPAFISVFHMGVRGATLAAILSRRLPAAWILTFLAGKRITLKSRPSATKLGGGRTLHIVGLGMSGFTMAITNSSAQVMYNATLQRPGGNLYVGIMTVISSAWEMISTSINGMTNSSQSVMGFSYGAREYGRVRKSIVFVSMACIIYTVIIWLFVHECSEFFIRIFNREGELTGAGTPTMHVYFFGFFMMSLQFSGQVMFVEPGKSKRAVFFSVFHKVIIVVPLILMLPTVFGLETTGILMAESISNFIGGATCSGTTFFIAQPELRQNKEKTDQ